MNKEKQKLVVIGGGAAGFFCAVNAARMAPGLEVLLLEKTGKLLSKVLVSGGGRCNVTHAQFDITALSKHYPRGEHFVRKAFYAFGAKETVEWFAKRGVPLKTEKDGRMFPVTDSSQTVADCLLGEARKHGVQIWTGAEVTAIRKEEDNFHVDVKGRQTIKAEYVCIATGGYPKAPMFDWLRHLGHSIELPVPSLFTFNLPKHPITALMGVSVPEAEVKIAGTKLVQTGPVLITHWGLSGPAVLKESAWGAQQLAALNYQFTALINWLPQWSVQQYHQWLQTARTSSGNKRLYNTVPEHLPARLWEFLCSQSGIGSEQRVADVSSKQSTALQNNVLCYTVNVQGKTTFKEEFVTAGGVLTSEVSHTTYMSKKIPNLFFAGEVLNVDGITGGFNFQHAWTSGWLAAKAVAVAAQGAVNNLPVE